MISVNNSINSTGPNCSTEDGERGGRRERMRTGERGRRQGMKREKGIKRKSRGEEDRVGGSG